MIYDIQKASIWKRISAFLFDAIILITLAVAVAMAVSAVIGYDGILSAYTDRQNEHKAEIEEKYKENGIIFDITEEEQSKLTDKQKADYEKANKELAERYSKDEILVGLYNMMINMSLIIIAISLLVAFLVLEFAVPLFLRNGRTLGKKIFGIAVMQANGTRVKNVAMFVRSILGKFTVETMIPVYVLIPFLFGGGSLMGLIAAGAILVVQIGMMLATKTNSALHDGLASTVVVDFATQMIFETEQELIEYKKQIAAKIAEERKY